MRLLRRSFLSALPAAAAAFMAGRPATAAEIRPIRLAFNGREAWARSAVFKHDILWELHGVAHYREVLDPEKAHPPCPWTGVASFVNGLHVRLENGTQHYFPQGSIAGWGTSGGDHYIRFGRTAPEAVWDV